VLQADSFAGFDQVLAAHAAEFRIVQNKVREFSALLNESNVGKALHFVVKAMETDKFAQRDSRVVEAERLVKVAGQKILLHHRGVTPLSARFQRTQAGLAARKIPTPTQ
jgi:hypothetical protein